MRLYDPSDERANTLARELDAIAVGSLQEGLEGQPGIALVCSPPVFHLEHAHEAVAARWDLFVEKPLSVSAAGVDDLAREAAAQELVTLVGFNLRFERGLLRVRDLLASGELGRPLAVRAIFGQYLPDWHPWEDYRGGYSARRELGGGALLDNCHEIDTLVWLFGDPDRVWCQAGRASELELDSEDVAQLSLRFARGPYAQVQLDYLQRAPRRELEIALSEGTIRWRYDERRLDVFTPSDGWSSEPLQDDHNETYVAEIAHLLEAASSRSPTRCDLDEGSRALRVVDAARSSAGL